MKIGCALSYCLQVCNNCDCDWELPASNATWESESWFCHLPCAHPYYWYKVKNFNSRLQKAWSDHISTPLMYNPVICRSYFEAMRWLHQTGRWDRDAASADRVIPNSFKPHEVELQLFSTFFVGTYNCSIFFLGTIHIFNIFRWHTHLFNIFPWHLHIGQLDHS